MAEPLEQVEKGWPVIKKAPFHFIGAVLAFVALGWVAIYLHYAAVINGKDATIEAKNSVIESKEATIAAKEKAVESIQQTVTAKDDLIISLTNQFHQIVTFQKELSMAQTNLLEQQKKLEDVEYLVRNIFEKTVTENFLGSDSSRMVVVRNWGNVCEVLFLFKAVPIANSIHGIMTGGNLPSQVPIYPINQTHSNLGFARFKNSDIKNMEFQIQYIKDLRQTNRFHTMELQGTNVFLDGIRIEVDEGWYGNVTK